MPAHRRRAFMRHALIAASAAASWQRRTAPTGPPSPATKSHPANFGRLCSKGSALGETLGHETRLLHPMLDGVRTSWDAALQRIGDGLRSTIERHGPDAVAFYLSGQLLT